MLRRGSRGTSLLALLAALSLVIGLTAGTAVSSSSGGGSGQAEVAKKKKKKCKKGYVLKKVKRKKRIRGKVRTVKVKRCVKKKKKKAKRKGTASCPTPYLGRATAMDRVFQYGDVRVDRTCGEVTRVEIKSVSTNCNTGSYTFLMVFNPASPDILITGGSNKIVGNKLHVVYRPDKTSANQTTMDITFAGKTATGEFHSLGNCRQDGLFTANAG